MRLDRLDLTRYGRFTDAVLTLAPPGAGAPDLHVIYGPNEAGKSTLFSAWLDLLFGIPMRSRYDFLHRGPTMRIGARLTHAGGATEVRRVKKTAASLLDGQDAPLPDGVLDAPLAGLTREGYSAMFSLDDETLEQGGDSILASRGDLGQMLFSASAGLAELSPRLEVLREDLDSFHRTGKRSGWLYDAKKRLAELEAERKRQEVSASALQRLTREASAAEQAWRDARLAEDEAQARLDRLTGIAAALPLADRLASLRAQLAPLASLPDIAADLHDRHAGIERARLELTTRIRDRAVRLQALRDKQAALADDPPVLAQADAIAEAEALRPEHDAALNDLSRRMDEAARMRASLAAMMAELGLLDAAPADVVLPPARLTRLRALLAERSGLLAGLAGASAETCKAAALLTRERALSGDPGPEADDAALAALVRRLRAQDPSDARDRALRDRDEAQGHLTAALARLAPWTGEAATLAALTVPADWQIRDWQISSDAATREVEDRQRQVASLQDRLAARIAPRHPPSGGVTLADAAAARSRREACWADHLQRLNQTSARTFEQALREDDRLSALMAEALAEARREALQRDEQAQIEADLTEARMHLDAARTGLRQVHDQIDAACRALGLAGASLADLAAWLERRAAALAALDALHGAEAALERGTEAVTRAGHSLALALGPGDGTRPFEVMLAAATARLDAAESRREAHRRLTALAADLRDREEAEARAKAVLDHWRHAWSEACDGSILAPHADDDPALGAMLEVLDRLGSAARDLAGLEDRIAKMQANRDRFRSARAAVIGTLGMPEASGWDDVLDRLRRAREAVRMAEDLAERLDAETRQDREDQDLLALRDRDLADLGRALRLPEGDTDLAAHIAACHEATRLRHEIQALQDQLRDHPQPAEGDDAASIRQRIEALRAEVQLLRHTTEARLEDHLQARRQIEAVGGDEALARIASDRHNLLEEIRDRAMDHLRMRFGLMAFETGLRRYRDAHRSDMLARASDAFSRLTAGRYAGLTSQPDGANEVLMAISASEGAKTAVDLSKGTRFQLYLALRIAGYHELAKSRPSVPFIADDIMETFDDQRSTAAFGLLADMSRLGQVIYLTHHRHLCDIARTACPSVNVVDLHSI